MQLESTDYGDDKYGDNTSNPVVQLILSYETNTKNNSRVDNSY